MEIEMRVKVDNFDGVIKKITQMGAVLVKEQRQIDVYYGETSLYDKLGYSFMLRVRREGVKSFLTYKGAKLKIDGVWEEYETEISDPEAVVEMLVSSGFDKIIEVSKIRKEYKLEKFSICLDKIENLGSFVEIEEVGEGVSQENVYNLIKEIGLDSARVIKKGYIALLLAQAGSPYSRYINN